MSAGHGSSRAGAAPTAMRYHDADGVSREACAVISRHGLDRRRVLDWADRHGAEKSIDFNLTPTNEFRDAPPGGRPAEMAYRMPAFGPLRERFDRALRTLDCGTSDGIMDGCLRDGIVEQAGKSIYAEWRRCAEMLEGLNVSLFRTTKSATRLRRFIRDFDELGNYKNGRWRQDGDEQDRVSTTVGTSNFLLEKAAVAVITYDTGGLGGWIQPVRYSPYPRHLDARLERFGCEKDGSCAAEGEVHIHTGCPIPSRRYIKITMPPSKLKRTIAKRYGDVAIVE